MSERKVPAIPGAYVGNIVDLERIADLAAARAAAAVRDHCLTAEDVQNIVREGSQEAARSAVLETLRTLGVDPSNPFEMQRDFQHLRAWRQSVETMKRQGFLSAIGVFVAGGLGILYLHFTKGAK